MSVVKYKCQIVRACAQSCVASGVFLRYGAYVR